MQNLIKFVDWLNEGDSLYMNPAGHVRDVYMKMIEKPDVIELHKRDNYHDVPGTLCECR